MSGKSETKQQSTTEPWKPAQPALTSILGQLQGMIPNSGITPGMESAFGQLESSAQQGNPFAGQIGGVVGNLLNGGGATAQAPAIQSAFDTFKAQTNPLASNTNYDPMQTPGLADSLKTMMGDIGTSINGQFAAAGRDLSGMNTQTLARGLTQGLAPILTQQYNQNVQNQQGAASNLYNAGNTTGGLLAGLDMLADLVDVDRHGRIEVAHDALDVVKRHLPDPEEAEDVVDAIGVEIAAEPCEAGAPPGVVIPLHDLPVISREAPVLAFHGEGIRRRAGLRGPWVAETVSVEKADESAPNHAGLARAGLAQAVACRSARPSGQPSTPALPGPTLENSTKINMACGGPGFPAGRR